ncbi:glycosyltransferase family 2 protein [Endozoicomonas acroporae]|uniref:glycosyltransferase family 2 protein n=1 Tax=Endozoicomonas acroporae TaxID=1701104 RepID=UPI0013D119C9|nr:glycosyltransferase [Endozoicomonas acroporae]
MSLPLITFVIPTRNRQECLLSLLGVLERFYAQKSQLFNVVILDNSDKETLSQRVTNLSFSVEYIYSNEQLSVVDNFNQGVNYLSGEYACFIGDDDLISERIFDLAELMKNQAIDAAVVSPKTKAIYFWPGIVDARWGDVGGNLYFSECSGKVRIIDTHSAIQASKSRVCDGPLNLPRAYSGLIAKRCIDQVVEKYGALFGGCSPDIYSSRLLSSVVKRYVVVELPFLVAGASKMSTSAARSERSDIGGLRDNDHIGRFGHLHWDPIIPEFYSPFTVWSQSYLHAEELLGGKFSPSTLAYLYVKCLLFARGNSKHVMNSINLFGNKLQLLMLMAVKSIAVISGYCFDKLPLLINQRPGACTHECSELLDSDNAMQYLDSYIKDIPLNLI